MSLLDGKTSGSPWLLLRNSLGGCWLGSEEGLSHESVSELSLWTEGALFRQASSHPV